jgi:hypothetical protein
LVWKQTIWQPCVYFYGQFAGISVHQLDDGKPRSVDRENLFELDSKFLATPAQAICVQLKGTRPFQCTYLRKQRVKIDEISSHLNSFTLAILSPFTFVWKKHINLKTRPIMFALVLQTFFGKKTLISTLGKVIYFKGTFF